MLIRAHLFIKGNDDLTENLIGNFAVILDLCMVCIVNSGLIILRTRMKKEQKRNKEIVNNNIPDL